MAVLDPYAEILLGDMISAYGLLQAPPMAYFVPVKQVNDESGSSISGRYLKHKGAAVGTMRPKAQDTFLTGTTGRTGRAFNAIGTTASSWTDGNKASAWGNYRLLFTSNAANAAFEIVSNTTTTNIENAEILITRGSDGAGSAPSKSNFNAYLHLAYGQKIDFRAVMEHGSPVRLDKTTDFGATWNPVDIAPNLGSWHNVNAANGLITKIVVLVDYNDNTVSVEVGEGNFLYHAPKMTEPLPTIGKIRFIGQSNFAALEYYPLRGEAATVTKAKRDFGRVLNNAPRAFVANNALTPYDAAQTTTPNITTDGTSIGVSITASKPDAGDGLGSATAATISDFSLVIPADWYDGGSDDPRLGFLPGIRVEELQVFDTITRTSHTSAMVTASNRDAYYAGAFGHVAAEIRASNDGGATSYRRIMGVGGGGAQGVNLSRRDPTRLIRVPIVDRSYVMGRDPAAAVSLNQEVIFDRWCLYSAVRFLAEVGNIHPKYLVNIPLYVPPGATADAPYGPAGYDCPPDYPILPSGTGLNALFRELPDRTVWSILQELVSDSGTTDPYTGGIAPFYTGFDADGYLHFEPIFWSEREPVIAYSSFDPSGVGQIEQIDVYNVVSQMRSRVDLYGIDPRTFELLLRHMPMPDAVIQAIGFDFGYTERNSRYSGAYMEQVANAIVAQASQPQQIIKMRVPFNPWVFAGDLCVVAEEVCIGAIKVCVIEELYSAYGMQDVTGRSGYRDCFSVVTCRPLENVQN